MADRKLSDWIKGYQEFTAESDSPEVFHMWGCLSTIAGAAQRKIYMQTAYFPVLSNLYILMVSPPGRGRKTSAMRVSKQILGEIKPEVNFAAESGSFEAIVDLFLKITNPEHQSLSLYSSELGTLMSTNLAGMVDFLTDIYDGNSDWSRALRQYKDKKVTIARPWLNLVAGTTPKWLGEKAGLIAAEGGLMARCIIAYTDEIKLENPWPKMTEPMRRLRDALIHDLSIVATLNGEFIFDGEEEGDAFAWFDAYYRDKPERWTRMADRLRNPFVPREFKSRYPAIYDPRTGSYYDRKFVHLLKVAMLLSLSYKNQLVLTLEDLLRAKAMLDSTEPGMRLALNAVGKSDTTIDLAVIYSQIKTAGRIPFGTLLNENYHNLRYGIDSLDQLVRELIIMGRVRREGDTIIYVDRNGS